VVAVARRSPACEWHIPRKEMGAKRRKGTQTRHEEHFTDTETATLVHGVILVSEHEK
jgi:hypothetical protein